MPSRIVSIKCGMGLVYDFPAFSRFRCANICAHTYKYGYSLKKTSLVVTSFPSVHSDSINYVVDLLWG